MIDCSASLLQYLQGAALTFGFLGFIAGCAALSAHKRNRLLIRRIADEIHKSVGTKPT